MTRLLAEDLLLLCWDDEKGRLHQRCSTTVGPGVGGALVIDAVLAEALAITDDRVRVTGTDPGDPMLAGVMAAAHRRRPPGVARLVQQVGTPGRYKAVRDRLVDRGVLSVDRRRLLGTVAYTRYPPADAVATEGMRETVRALLTGRVDPADADPRAVVLAGLAMPSGAGPLQGSGRSTGLVGVGKRDAGARGGPAPVEESAADVPAGPAPARASWRGPRPG